MLRISSLLAILLAAPLCSAQGLLVDVTPEHHIRLPRPIPRPTPTPGSYKVQAIEVDAKLSGQTARVQVSQKFQNTGSRTMEVAFVFPLPYDGAIDQLTLMVDGKELEAKLLPADKARAMYEEIVRKNQDPALLEWIGTGLFKTSVFPVPAGAERTVTLKYTQLCRKSGGLTDFVFPLSTAKYTTGPLDKLRLRVAIESPTPIASVYSPSHEVKVERTGKTRAIATFEAKNTLPSSDFRLMVDAANQGLGASVVSFRPEKNEPGYFLLLASPELPDHRGELPPKTVLFVVDRSGSMSGKKFDQAKGALRFVLNNLNEKDTFNIVAYDTAVEAFRPELQKYSAETRDEALGFVEGLFAGGSTNIDGALQRALGMLKDSDRPTYVLFLTDGLPTAGQTGEAAIVAASEKANSVRARVFPFGVGYDVNSRLLDRLARAGHGQTEFVKPDDDIEESVSRLYNRLAAPVLTRVQLAIDVEGLTTADGPAVTRVYPQGEIDLFSGDQLVLVGRYARGGDAKVTLKGELRGEEKTFAFPAKLSEKSGDDSNAFVAKLWATRRVGEIIDQIDLNGKNQELVNELVELATKHGIVTQYTSFLADETADPNAVASNRQRAEEGLADLGEAEGRFGFAQRSAKLALQSAAAPMAGPVDAFAAGGRAMYRELAGKPHNLGRQWFYDAKEGRTRSAGNIMQLGRKTFFLRGDKWIDSAVSESEEKGAQTIERYGADYFNLAEKHGKHVAQYLAIDAPVVVELDGQVYTW
ncbi:von Willebrand factor type A domain protein [Pirellulimonas nuda]|uniref:von Willebrand factor type A domain protein n=1 Tax=Pirellulimonas nuda TaxID=2528009 RepID=A0A518D9D4_9BACT|nr:VIT domain-containing protein [Pirellulimonas nuda]QDU88084.1 von Willebrand factor type A domain protein [Pirellulimonas nuda]